MTLEIHLILSNWTQQPASLSIIFAVTSNAASLETPKSANNYRIPSWVRKLVARMGPYDGSAFDIS